MKIVTYIITCLCFINTQAQDPRLFEQSWYLNELTINEVEIDIPSNDELEAVYLNINKNSFVTGVCDETGTVLNEFNNETFIAETFVFFEIMCNVSENQSFQEVYFEQFLSIFEVDVLFNYELVEDGDSLTLFITNTGGDVGVYGTESLAVSQYSEASFVVFPNPATDVLYLKNETQAIRQVSLLDINGNSLLSKGNVTTLDIARYPIGIYFLEIVSENSQRIVRKIIKH